MSKEYGVHPLAKLFPEMPEAEYRHLRDGIRRQGLLQPITLLDGQILDGVHRNRACRDLGVDAETKPFAGGDPLAYVMSLNLKRRHLTPSQRAMIAADTLPLFEKEAKKRRKDTEGRPKKTERKNAPSKRKASDDAAKTFDVSPRYVEAAKDIKKKNPELAKKVLTGDVTISAAKKLLKKEAKRAVKQNIKLPADLAVLVTLHHANISSLSGQVPSGTVDWIITDPPYEKKALKHYDALGELAADVLKSGGSLICMVGQSYLPNIVQLLSKHLTYHWTLAYLTPGGQAAQMWQRKVNTFWKPLLWFTKGKYEGDWIGDVCSSATNDNDKEHHHWGQSESGMADIIERFTNPGDKILDPFLGGGTTAVVAAQMGRRFIGLDVDKDCINRTRERISNV